MNLEEAKREFGGVSQIAGLLGISVQAVYKWKVKVPELRVYQLREKSERLADGCGEART